MSNEFIKVRGDVVITKIYNDGRREQQELRNLVVNGGKTILAKLLGHDAAYVNEYLASISFGTGTVAPAVADTALGAEVVRKTAVVTYPATNSVMFSATMLDTEGGTSTYTEIGLLSSTTAKLFSRLAIPAIVKSSLYKIQVDWTISFQ